MSFQIPGPRIAGRDSSLSDIRFSSEISKGLLDVGYSPLPDKRMYGDDESIKSWIDTITRHNSSVLKPEDPVSNGFEFFAHPFKTYHSRSPFSQKIESDSSASLRFDSSVWAPEVFASSYREDSEESHSTSSFSDNAQYVTIPYDSPWYRHPSPSPGPHTAYEFNTAPYTSSCSSDVRQAIAQQKVLLAVFYEELRRVVPRGDSEYDPEWLGDVDVDLVLAPLETYADLCWESAVCDKSRTARFDRPLPDVPIGFDDV